MTCKISCQVTFISIALYTIQIVSKQLHRDKQEIAESIMETHAMESFRFSVVQFLLLSSSKRK